MTNIRPKDLPAAGSVAADAALIIDSGTAVLKATPAQILAAAGGGGSGATVGAWSTFATTTVPAPVIMVVTDDTLLAGSATGTSSARYKLDPEQTEFTALMTSYINASVADGTTLSVAQQAMRDHQKFWRRKSANNRYFTLAEPEPHMGMFGCPGDGGQAYDNTMSGTDVFNGTTVLNAQAFIDYCLYFAKLPGKFNTGTHRCSAGLQIGYGRGFGPGYIEPRFTGAGQAFVGASSFAGTTFVFDSDAFNGINVASYRNGYLGHFTVRGKYSKWSLDNVLPYNASVPVLDNLDPVSWIDQTGRQTQNGRFNPYCGISLGAFDGAAQAPVAWATSTVVQFGDAKFVSTRLYECVLSGTTASTGAGPTGTDTTATIIDGTAKWRYVAAYSSGSPTALTAYPEPYKPAWLMNPAKTAFGNIYFGSFLTLDNITFDAWHVGFCSKPCANSAQYDYTAMLRCNFAECRYSVSICNDQSRNFVMRDCNSALCDCTVTNMVHGNRVGLLNPGVFANLSSGASVDVFRVSASYGGGMTFDGLYTESQRRLGQVLGGGSQNAGPTFNDPNIIFPFVAPERGIAPRYLYGEAQGSANVGETTFNGSDRGARFNGGTIGVDNVFGAFIEGTSFNGTQVYAFNRNGTVNVSQAAFHNYTGGGLILPGLEYRFSQQKLIFSQKNLDTGAGIASQVNTDRGFHSSDRTTGVPAMVKSARALNTDRAEEVIIPHRAPFVIIIGSGGVTAAVSGSDATEFVITYPGATQAVAELVGYCSGSVALHGPSGMSGYVRAYDDTAKTITIVAQDNFKTVAGVKSYIFPVSTTSGAWAFTRGGMYLPATPCFGNLNATTAISSVGASNGVGTTLTNDIAAGDYLVSPPLSNALAPEAATVSSRTNGSPGSMVLSVAANKTRTEERLIFRRPSPANT